MPAGDNPLNLWETLLRTMSYAEVDQNFKNLLRSANAWVAGTYEPNQVVVHNGGVYACITQTTTEPNPTPGISPHWVAWTRGDEMRWAGKWSAGTYYLNQVVVNRGEAWVCIVTSTLTEPGTSAGLLDWYQLGGSTLELWQATAMPSMAGGVIQFTFVPIYTGQTPVLLTESAGVFTFQESGVVIDFDLEVFVSHEMAANNSETDYVIDNTYSGSGVNTILPITGFAQSTRTGSFSDSKFTAGRVIAIALDTIQFTGNSTGTNGSDVDLLNMFLQISGPRP